MTLGTDDWATRLADRLDPRPNPYLSDPVAWVHDKLTDYTTVDQGRILESVRDHRYTAVPSCHDIGKSFTGGRVMTWWIDTHKQGDAFGVSTAPTTAQVHAILWREIGRAHRAGSLDGYVTGQSEWKLRHARGPSELVAYGRKPADYDPAAFQGIHARYVLVVIDEACGVPRAIFDAVDSLATNEHARVLAIGNPDDPSSHFHEICKPGSGWHVIQLDALRSPGFTRDRVARYPELQRYMIQEGIPPTDEVVPEELYDLLVSPTWVSERLRRWGKDSPLFQSKVRGRFPTITNDTLIHPHWVVLAQAREMRAPETMARIGVDVARYGNDHTIILLRRGGHCRVVHDIPSGPVTEVAGKVIEVGLSLGVGLVPPLAVVDDPGVGGGVTDILSEEAYPVQAFIGSAASAQRLPNGKARFENARSESYWNLREALAGPSGTGEEGWLDLDPLDDELAAQITNIKYRVNRHGQICVETKDDMKSRGIGSPDRGDALVLSLVPDRRRTEPEHQTERMLTADLLGTRW